MTDRAAFLAAICAAPDDDAPRLIYADWLDEQGESERAAWIRTQIELVNLQSGHVCRTIRGVCILARCNKLNQLENELWDIGTVGGGFLEVPGYYGRVHWIRGFIERIRLSMSDAAQHLAAIVKEHPIRRVEFTDRVNEIDTPNGLIHIRDHDVHWPARFPNIEFVLPPEPRPQVFISFDDPSMIPSTQEERDAMWQSMVGSNGVITVPPGVRVEAINTTREHSGGWNSLAGRSIPSWR